MTGKRVIAILVVAFALVGISFQFVSADHLTSTSYIIDGVANANSGGSGTSTSYKLTSSAGETAIGNGASGSYLMGMGFVSQLTKSLALTVQPSGLVAHYTLDEPSGTLIADQSVYGAYGTAVGTPGFVAGKIGTALSFNGSSQAVPIANNAQTQLTSSGTIETWIKSSTTTGSLAAVSKSSSFWLGLGSGKAATYDWTSGITTADSVVIADGSWHHIAVTLNSGVANGSTLYVDGVAKQTFIWTPQFQSGIFTIGSVYNGTTYSQYFNGSIDHVKVLNRILSADEIQAEYSGQNSGNVSGLSLGTITPGTSNATLSDVIVQTDAGSYTLSINQDHNLQSGANTIPAVSGSIAVPAAWTEGTTKGLGFTLTATNATAIPGAWSSGSNYAAFPGTATTFYTRTGQQSSSDYLTMRVRADVASTQAATGSAYTNTITVTGTITP